MSQRLVSPLIFLLGLCSPVLASAEPRDSVELEWTAPAECPPVDTVRARLRKLAGNRKPSSQPLRAEVTITRNEDGGLHLRLLVRSGSVAGERNMDGKSCTALAGAAAVTLVLLLQATEPLTESDLAGSSTTANTGTTTASAAGDATRDTTTNATDDATTRKHPALRTADPHAASDPQHASSRVRDDQLRSERRWHVLLQFPQIDVGFGPLHEPSLGLAAAGGASIDRWRFLAKGSWWLPQRASASNADQPYGAEIKRVSASLLACRALLRSWFELSPCASLAVQHLSARGTGAHVGGRNGTATWFALGFGGQGRAHIAPWLNLFIGVDAQLQMSQPQLSVDEIGPVERLLPAALVTTLGSEWNF